MMGTAEAAAGPAPPPVRKPDGQGSARQRVQEPLRRRTARSWWEAVAGSAPSWPRQNWSCCATPATTSSTWWLMPSPGSASACRTSGASP